MHLRLLPRLILLVEMMPFMPSMIVLPSIHAFYLFPSYFCTILVATSPFEPSSPQHNVPLNEPYYEEPEAPVLSLGERIAWIKETQVEFGIVRWIGRMPQVSPNWTVGVEFVSIFIIIITTIITLIRAFCISFTAVHLVAHHHHHP